MKKILSLLLTFCICLSLCLALSSCGDDANNDYADDNYEENGDTENNENESDDIDDEDEQEHVHSYSAATCSTPEMCACGATRGYTLAHTYSEATCTAAQICSACGATGGSALGHSYEEATCTEPKICKRCNITSGAPLDHDYRDATCTAPQICKRCEDMKGEPLGHSFSEATCFLPMTCTVCEEIKGNALGHSYVNNICIRCEQIDPDSLPTLLESLWVIDKSNYSVKASCTDSYGNNYTKAHTYDAGYSIHNLNMEYSTFTGSIIYPHYAASSGYIELTIYLDDVAVYTTGKINKETPKFDFSLDVTGATKLKIAVTGRQFGDNEVCIVNAELER